VKTPKVFWDPDSGLLFSDDYDGSVWPSEGELPHDAVELTEGVRVVRATYSDLLRRMARRVVWAYGVAGDMRCPDCSADRLRPLFSKPGWVECRDCGASGPVHGTRDWALAEVERLRAELAESAHEIECPSGCGTTIRALMADAPVRPDAGMIGRAAKAAYTAHIQAAWGPETEVDPDWFWKLPAFSRPWLEVARAVAAELGLPTGKASTEAVGETG